MKYFFFCFHYSILWRSSACCAVIIRSYCVHLLAVQLLFDPMAFICWLCTSLRLYRRCVLLLFPAGVGSSSASISVERSAVRLAEAIHSYVSQRITVDFPVLVSKPRTLVALLPEALAEWQRLLRTLTVTYVSKCFILSYP